MSTRKMKRGIMSRKNKNKSKYEPHEGKQEKERRRKQIGRLKVEIKHDIR